MIIVVPFVFSAQRNLPTDLGLPANVTFSVVCGCDVKGTARATFKTNPIEKDAGIVLENGDHFAVFRAADDIFWSNVLELPLFVGQEFGFRPDIIGISLIDKVGSVATTSLDEFGGGSRQHPLAPIAKDAVPV